MSAGEIDTDNTFSPKHFYRYIKDTKVCAEYYGEWWYTLDLKTPITSVETRFHVCLENAQCSYFAFDSSVQTCKILYILASGYKIFRQEMSYFFTLMHDTIRFPAM